MKEIKSEYKNGQLRYKYQMEGVNFHGLQQNWHENGKIEDQHISINGRIHGTKIWWRENGSVSDIRQFKMHERHGPRVKFKYDADIKLTAEQEKLLAIFNR